jgi:fructokinase
MKPYGLIEGGGTKFLVATAQNERSMSPARRIDTTKPREVLAQMVAWFREHPVRAIGCACFGPLDLKRGSISRLTPKKEWRGFSLRQQLEDALAVPVTVETDVNAAAMAEWRWGAARGRQSVVYVTVGTGIGGGVCLDGVPVHGLLHPELGHLRIQRHGEDHFAGTCPSHQDCLEGLACGPAIAQRGEGRFTAGYLGQLVHNIAVTLSPEMVILGGGVMQTKGLLAAVRKEAAASMNGYVPLPKIVQPGLGENAGLLGGLSLVLRADRASRKR